MKTILVVDDEFDLTCTLRAVLEHNGYRAETCSNGREAVEAVTAKRPDLMILDVMMPLGNGFDVLDSLRAREELSDLPVILINSVPPPPGRTVQWQLFLKKPLSIVPLLGGIERLIGKS